MYVVISCSIQLPLNSSATPTPTAFGTNDRVASWIWVTDWNREMPKPRMSAVSRIGAPSFNEISNACMPSCTTSCVGHGVIPYW